MRQGAVHRVRAGAFWLFLALYVLIAALGAWAVWLATGDADIVGLFSSFWWIPSGLVAWWAKWHVEQYLYRRLLQR